MTLFEIEQINFNRQAVDEWARLDRHKSNWPVVYLLEGDTTAAKKMAGVVGDVYVGESLNAASRMRQHLDSDEKKHLSSIRFVVDDRFNKSVCLDLESYLIRLLAGDGAHRVLNRNDGVIEANYFDRDKYQERFQEIFDELKRGGIFTRTVPEIENSDLFKLSPFKALTHDQAAAVEDILDGFFADLSSGEGSTIVVQGDPGTGKTVVAIYLLKLLADIERATDVEDLDSDTLFSEFFAPEYRELLETARIGFVVPQQSLRESIKKVFRKTPGLNPEMVMTAFDVGQSRETFDLLVVDEAHRLNQRANQPSGVQNQKFRQITEALFGCDDKSKTQLDWIRAKSKHQIFLLDAAQRVRPADLSRELLDGLVDETKGRHRHYSLISQMRVKAGADYVGYVRRLFGAVRASDTARVVREEFDGYDFRLFDSLEAMRDEIRLRDAEFGLARMVAGYAWKWKTKNDQTSYDIEVDGLQLRWNSTQTDWIASKGSLEDVGSIHTVQGYDLNYAGVIIGPDLRYDPEMGRMFIDRASYFDAAGKQNNKVLGKIYTDDDLLGFIANIYAVLLTRGIRGTYVFVSDPALREYLGGFIPA